MLFVDLFLFDYELESLGEDCFMFFMLFYRMFQVYVFFDCYDLIFFKGWYVFFILL